MVKKGAVKKKVNKNPYKYGFYALISILILFLLVVLFYQATKGQTGSDNMGSDFVRTFDRGSRENLTSEDNEFIEEDKSINNFYYPDPIDPSKHKSSGGSPGDKKGDILPEVLSGDINDTDIYDIGDGTMHTLNLWKIGTCYDAHNLIGELYDSCSGSILTEYYLENETCVLTEVDCLKLIPFFGSGTLAGCSRGACLVKVGGINFTKKDYLIFDGVAVWDECTSSRNLREYYIDDNGYETFMDIDCSKQFTKDSYCDLGACIVVEEKEKFSCDTFCKSRPEYIGGNSPLCSSGQELISYNSTIQCCCTEEPIEPLVTDYGHNITIKGECMDSVDLYQDHCIDSKTLREYYVDSSNKYYCTFEDVTCNGVCEGGKCIAYDEDASYETGQYSSPSKCYDALSGIYEDTCYCPILGVCQDNQLLLKEWKIINGKCVSESVNCTEEFGTGYRCGNEGACISRVMG